MKKVIVLCMAMLITVFFCSPHILAEEDSNTEDGVVEIQTGFKDQNGSFKKVKNCEGFVISSNENTTYIVALYNKVKITEDEKKNYIESNNLGENAQLEFTIRIPYGGGDPKAQIIERTINDEYNFVILSTESELGKVSELKLGNSKDLKDNQSCYTLGYESSKLQDSNFSSNDIIRKKLVVKNPNYSANQLTYLETDFSISDGFNGSPVLNEDDYVVGINDKSIKQNGEQTTYVIPIDEVQNLLDSVATDINYKSYDYDQALSKLMELANKCSEKEKKDYSKESFELLKQELEYVNNLTNSSEKITLKMLNEEYEKLESVHDALIPSSTVIKKIGIGLLIVSLFLAIFDIIRFKNNKKIVAQINDIRKEINAINNSPQPTHELGSGENMNVFEKVDSQLASYLYHDKSDSWMELTKSIRIGKRENENDFVIMGNKMVSGNHCKIVKNGDLFVIYDNDSLNGTFINGNKLEKEGCILKDGDEIRLATEVFHFKKK